MSLLASFVTVLFSEMISLPVTAIAPAVLVSLRMLPVTVWLPLTEMPFCALTSSVLPPVTLRSPLSVSVVLTDTMPSASMSALLPSVTVSIPVRTSPATSMVRVLCLFSADASTVMVFRATLPALAAFSATLVLMVAVPPFFTTRFLSAAVTLPSAVFSSQITPSTMISPSRLVSP